VENGPQNPHHEHIVVLSATKLIFVAHDMTFFACKTTGTSLGGLSIVSK
jgi:hypothetical protein